MTEQVDARVDVRHVDQAPRPNLDFVIGRPIGLDGFHIVRSAGDKVIGLCRQFRAGRIMHLKDIADRRGIVQNRQILRKSRIAFQHERGNGRCQDKSDKVSSVGGRQRLA